MVKLADKLISMNDDSLNSLGQLPKDGISKKNKNKVKKKAQAIVIIESAKLPNNERMVKNVLASVKILDKYDKRIALNKTTLGMVADEIGAMAWEIGQSMRGNRGHATIYKENGKDLEINTSNKSTFPEYLQRIYDNHGTAKSFYGSIRKGKGKYWDKIVKEALDRLYNGYKNAHGYDGPSVDFKKAIDGVKFETDKEFLARVEVEAEKIRKADNYSDFLPF